MSGKANLKILAVAIFAVLSVAAVSVAVTYQNQDCADDGVTAPAVTYESYEQEQSGSMQMLMQALSILYLYVNEDDGETINYDYVYGAGETFSVSKNPVKGNVLMKDKSTISFSDCNALIMDGGRLSINGEVSFVNDSGEEFTITLRNGAEFVVGSDIVMALSSEDNEISTITATPFVMSFKTDNKINPQSITPESTLSVKGQFSLNLDDTIDNGKFEITHNMERGDVKSDTYRVSDITYKMKSKVGSEAIITLDYDFTEYYKFIQRFSGEDGKDPHELTVADWIKYFFSDEYIIPEGNASFYLNGMYLKYHFKESSVSEYVNDVATKTTVMIGDMIIDDTEELNVGIEMYNASEKDNTPKNGTIRLSADSLGATYDETITTYDVTVEGSSGESNVVSSFVYDEELEMDDFATNLVVNPEDNIGKAEFSLKADSFSISSAHDLLSANDNRFISIEDIDMSIQINKDNVDDLYTFIEDVMTNEDIMSVITGADYSVIMCDAIISIICDDGSFRYTHKDMASVNDGSKLYAVDESTYILSVDDFSFSCDYLNKETAEIESNDIVVSMETISRSMSEVYGGAYIPTASVYTNDVDMKEFKANLDLELGGINELVKYITKLISGEDLSDTDLRDLDLDISVKDVAGNNDILVRFSSNPTFATNEWPKEDPSVNELEEIAYSIKSSIDVDELNMSIDIDNNGAENSLVELELLELKRNSDYPDDNGQYSLDFDMTVTDVNLYIESDRVKFIEMSLSFLESLSAGDDLRDSLYALKEFFKNYFFDGTDMSIHYKMTGMKLSADSEITDQKNNVLSYDRFDFFVGDKNGVDSSKKEISFDMVMKAGSNESKAKYHDSTVSLSTDDDTILTYSLDAYDPSTYTIQNTEYEFVGINVKVDINKGIYEGKDKTIAFTMSLLSESMVSKDGTDENGTLLEMSTIDSDLYVEVGVDNAYNAFNLIMRYLDNPDMLITIMSTTEFDKLLAGTYVHETHVSESYFTETVAMSSILGEKVSNSEDYTVTNYEFFLDYRNSNYFSLDFDRIRLETHMDDITSSVIDKTTVTMESDDLNILAYVDISGVDDVVTYIIGLMNGDEVQNIKENIDLDLTLSENGTVYEYINKVRQKDESGEFVDYSSNDLKFEIEGLTLSIVLGTTGKEQVSVTTDGMSVTNSIIVYDHSTVDEVFTIGYGEASIGSDSKGLFNLLTSLYQSYRENGKITLTEGVAYDVAYFLMSDSNSKAYANVSYFSVSAKTDIDDVKTEYKIELTRSEVDKFAMTASCSAKVSCDDHLNFKISGTNFSIGMASDSKLSYSSTNSDCVQQLLLNGFSADLTIYEPNGEIELVKLITSGSDYETNLIQLMEGISVKGILMIESGEYVMKPEMDKVGLCGTDITAKDEVTVKVDIPLSSILKNKDASEYIFTATGTDLNVSSYFWIDRTLRITESLDISDYEIRFNINSGEFKAGSVDAVVKYGDQTYDMYTDGTEYFGDTFGTFVSFTLYNNGTVVKIDPVVDAPYIKVSQFTVSEDSDLYSGRTFIKGTNLKLTTPEDSSSGFAGWSINGVMVPKSTDGSSVFYTPLDDYVSISYVYGYILSYDNDGGSTPDVIVHEKFGKTMTYGKDWSSNVDSKIMDSGETLDLSSVPTKDGYTFVSWNTSYTEMPKFNLTVPAKWTVGNYMLTIVYGNGTADKVQDIAYNTPIELPSDLEREGYTFGGWSDYTSGMKMPANDLTIKAIWSKEITSESVTKSGDSTVIDVNASVAVIDVENINNILSDSDSSGNIEMKFSDVTLSMESGSLEKLAQDEITGKTMELKMSVTKSETISEDIVKKISESDLSNLSKVRYTVSVDVSGNGAKNDLGEITVVIPIDSKYSDSAFEVYYIASDGTVEVMEDVGYTTVNGQDCITFKTDHFSYFALTEGGERPASSSSDSGSGSGSSSSMLYIVIGAVAGLIIVIGAVIIIMRHRY